MKTLTDAQLKELGETLGEALSPEDCEHDHATTVRVLGDMGLAYDQIEATVAEFKDLGGRCDCEVMFNVILGPEV